MLDATLTAPAAKRGRPPKKSAAAASELLLALPTDARFEALDDRQRWLLTAVYCYGLSARVLAELKPEDGHTEQSVAAEIHRATLLLLTAG